MITQEEYNNLKIGDHIIGTDGGEWIIVDYRDDLVNPNTFVTGTVMIAYNDTKKVSRAVNPKTIDKILR